MFDSVSAGWEHGCGLRDTGAVECWGRGRARTFEGPFVSVSAGENHNCGLRDSGEVECWGSDEYGQLTPPAGVFTSVSAGGNHSCGVRDTGAVICWGYFNLNYHHAE